MKSKILQIILVFVLALSLASPIQAGLLKKTVKGGMAGAVATKVVKHAVTKHASKIANGAAVGLPASQILARNMGGVPKGFAAHHIIPVQLQHHPILKKIGFDINQAANGIALPRTPFLSQNLSTHAGSHPVYTNGVKEALDSIPKHLSNTQIQNLIHKIINICRQKLTTKTPVHIKENVTPVMWNIKDLL